jgi:hypothetical protein
MKNSALVLLSLFCTCVYTPSPLLVLDRSHAQINFMPPAWQDEPVIVVDDSLSLSVFRDDNGKNRLSSVSVEYLYINKRNPNDFENIETFESPDVEGPQSMAIKAFYPDGTTWESNSSDVSVFPVVYDHLFQTDDVARRVIVPHYVEGMVIRLERRRELFRPEFINCEYLRQEYPIINKRIALSWPRDYSIIHCVKNAEGLQQIDTATVDNGRVEFIVKASMLGKIQKTNRIKNPEDWYAGFHFGIPPQGKRSYSWAQLGDYFLGVLDPLFRPSPKIAKWANSLGAHSPDSIISQAFALQQRSVRYYANLSNAHSFIPRSAEFVAEKGYGDCKEMATLLKSLCGCKGIELGFAMVSTEGNMQCTEEIPALGNFNHAIAYFSQGDSIVRFFDPTIDFGTAADSYFHLIGQKAFVLRKGASGIVTISQGSGYKNSVETYSTIDKKQSDGRWEMRGSIVMRGKSAYYFCPAYAEQKGDDAVRFLSKFLFETFNINALSCTVVKTTSSYLEISFTADIQRNFLTVEKGGLVLSAPSIFTGDVRYTTIKNEGPRYLSGFEQHDTWLVPKDFIDFDKHNLDHRFGRGFWTVKTGSIERTFTQKETVVPGEARKDLNGYHTELAKFMKSTCWR